MYESFYGLKEKPFTLLPDPEYLYLSQKHQRALTLLEYGMMNQAGFSVICGDTGAGKTTLIRRLLAELGDDTTVGLITNTHQSFGELLNWVLMAFGLDGEGKSKAQMHHMFIEFLIEQYARNKHTVLIVDEAQNMDAETLEELRMLSNINADKDQILQVILAGQPALRETLRKPELMQFAQRIAVDYYLESLNQDETQAYIEHRLEVAGASHSIFTKDACNAIYRYSGGTPRLINLLCDTALVYGFAEQTQEISAELVDDVVREQHANSIVPTFNMPLKEEKQQQVKVEQPVAARADDMTAIVNPVKEELETVIAELGQRARQAVSSFDSAARAAAEEVRESIQEKVAEVKAEPNKESKVTPIHQDVAMDVKHRDAASASREAQANKDSASEKSSTDNHQQGAKKESVEDTAAVADDFTDDEFVAEEVVIEPVSSSSGSHGYGRSDSQQRYHYEDTYPIIQVENQTRKNTSYLLLGIAGGMFVATIVMIVAGYFLFFHSSLQLQTGSAGQVPAAATISQLDQQRQQEIERARLDAIEKERDAALAMTRALERERDAAVAAAKAQEEMRAAERRAAELVAQQERRTAEEVRRAKEVARQAEIAAAKARERERIAQQQAEQARLEAEKAKAIKEQQQQAAAIAAPVAEPPPPVYKEAQAEEIEKPAQENGTAQAPSSKTPEPTKFSANPCNSASAKFLSTCKK